MSAWLCPPRRAMIPVVNANPAALGPGSRVGDYELLVPVGEGGMGRVWVARPRGTVGRGRLVAIKSAIVNPSVDSTYWKVLLDEARIASRIRHPNVCALHSAGREAGMVYLVMDWSDAGTLHDLLAESESNRLQPEMAARIGTRLCAALDTVHELTDDDGEPLQVVHRDVSPQNVLLSTNGQVRLTDFGVARARGQLHDPTQTGEVKGKISYMAPEQVTQRDFDRRVDVFATGCVLYEATTGSRPFGGDDALSTLYQLLEQPVTPPSERLADYPKELEWIVLKALAREPEQRFQTADELGRALEQFITSRRAVVGDAEIGALTRSVLRERIHTRERDIDEAMAKLDAPRVSTAPPSSLAVRTPGMPAARRVTARRQRLVGGTLGALLAATLVFAATHRAARTTAGELQGVPESSPPGAGPGVPTSEVRSEMVEVLLSATPAQARWHIDDGPELPNPHRLSVARDATPHEVRAVADGFEPFTRELHFDRSTELHAELSRTVAVPSKPSPKPVKPRPGPGKAASSAPRFTPPERTVSNPGPALGEPLPAPKKKPVRELDQDNPYTSG